MRRPPEWAFLLLSLFRVIMIPWPHFILLFVAITVFARLASQGFHAGTAAAAFAVVVFLAAGLTAMRIRQVMD